MTQRMNNIHFTLYHYINKKLIILPDILIILKNDATNNYSVETFCKLST